MVTLEEDGERAAELSEAAQERGGVGVGGPVGQGGGEAAGVAVADGQAEALGGALEAEREDLVVGAEGTRLDLEFRGLPLGQEGVVVDAGRERGERRGRRGCPPPQSMRVP